MGKAAKLHRDSSEGVSVVIAVVSRAILVALVAALFMSVVNELIRPEAVAEDGQEVWVVGVRAIELRIEAFGIEQYLRPLVYWYGYLVAMFFTACTINGFWLAHWHKSKEDRTK